MSLPANIRFLAMLAFTFPVGSRRVLSGREEGIDGLYQVKTKLDIGRGRSDDIRGYQDTLESGRHSSATAQSSLLTREKERSLAGYFFNGQKHS